MMQFFKKIGDFLFTRLGKNQSTQIQELDPRRPDLLAEDLPFDLTEAGVNEIHSGCDCECGNGRCKNSGLETLPNDPTQDAPRKEEDPEISQAASAETAPAGGKPKKIEKKPKGGPKKTSKEDAKEKPAEKKTTTGPKKNYYKKKKKAKDTE